MQDQPQTITVWRNNLLDSEEQLSISDLADKYLASVYPNIAMPLERKVSLFLMEENLTWEDRDAFNALCDLISERWHEQAAAL
jgi:hypothetical protein